VRNEVHIRDPIRRYGSVGEYVFVKTRGNSTYIVFKPAAISLHVKRYRGVALVLLASGLLLIGIHVSNALLPLQSIASEAFVSVLSQLFLGLGILMLLIGLPLLFLKQRVLTITTRTNYKLVFHRNIPSEEDIVETAEHVSRVFGERKPQ